jgi:hypothetical protein
MATRPKKPVEVGQAQVGLDQAAELLRKQVEAGGRLLAERPIDADAYSTWGMLTRNYLEKAFGTNSPNVTAVTSVGKYGSFPMNAGNEWWERHRAESLQSQLAKLNGLIELLVTEKELQSGHSIAG